ncbi:hypothetical protein PG984_006945 [Apiospora sp. TS-2023a]
MIGAVSATRRAGSGERMPRRAWAVIVWHVEAAVFDGVKSLPPNGQPVIWDAVRWEPVQDLAESKLVEQERVELEVV